jgi:hypothetical protein
VLDKIRNPLLPIVGSDVTSRVAMSGWLNHDNIALLERELVGIVDRNGVKAIAE